MSSHDVLYIGTVFMILIALFFITLTVWATMLVRDFKKFSKDRDRYYLKLISEMESLIKKEFLEVISSIKNYKNVN